MLIPDNRTEEEKWNDEKDILLGLKLNSGIVLELVEAHNQLEEINLETILSAFQNTLQGDSLDKNQLNSDAANEALNSLGYALGNYKTIKETFEPYKKTLKEANSRLEKIKNSLTGIHSILEGSFDNCFEQFIDNLKTESYSEADKSISIISSVASTYYNLLDITSTKKPSLIPNFLGKIYDYFSHELDIFNDVMYGENYFTIKNSRKRLDYIVKLYEEIPGTTPAYHDEISEYKSYLTRIAPFEKQLNRISERFLTADWTSRNIKNLKKLYKEVSGGWFSKGLIGKCRGINYPEGVKLAELLLTSMENVLNSPDETLAFRWQIDEDSCEVKEKYNQVESYTADLDGIKELNQISGQYPQHKYSDLEHDLYFYNIIENYMQQVKLFNEKIGELRGNIHQKDDFFSMIIYLDKHTPPSSYNHLNNVLMGKCESKEWIDRIALFTKETGNLPHPNSHEKEWLRHVKYAIHEDSVRGYLRKNMFQDRYVAVINHALAAIDRKVG